MKNRGVKDILILCADGLTGIKEAISAAFPKTEYQRLGLPTLVISHNKTLAAQLYGEVGEFFPENAVEYFVS